MERGELRQKNKDALKRKEELNDMLGAKQMEIAKIRGETEKIINDFNARLGLGLIVLLELVNSFNGFNGRTPTSKLVR